MNRAYNENYNNKYNLDPKWVKCASCSKQPQLRREEGKHVVSAYRGRNNEELCHKCACCYHCGKKEKWDVYRKVGYKSEYKWVVEEDYGMPTYHKIDKDNPSGGWEIAFCLDCRDKKGHKTFRYYDDREYWKVDGTIFNPEEKREWNNFENFKRAYEKAQDYWNSLSSSEREQECERLLEDMKLGKHRGLRGKEGEMFGWVPNNSWWGVENGKLVSREPQLVPVLIADEFVRKMFGDINLCKELMLRDYKIGGKDHSPSPNPATPTPQPITNSNDKGDNSVSPSNSPQPNPWKDNKSSETKNNVKTIKFENKESGGKNNPASNEKSPAKNDDKVLAIDLKNVKWISLTSEGNLIIKFKNEKSTNSSEIGSIQKITAEEIKNSQELQKIKNYCQKNGKSSLNSQELSNLIQNKTGSASVNPTENSGYGKTIWISVGIGIALIVGVTIGLWLKPKCTSKKAGQKIKQR